MIPFKLLITRVSAEVVTNLGCFSTHFLQERFLCLKFGDLLFPGWVSGVIPFSSAVPNQNEAQCPFSRDETPEELGDGAHFLGMTRKRNWKTVPFFQGRHRGGTGRWCPFSKADMEEELEHGAHFPRITWGKNWKMVSIFQGYHG